MFTNGNITMIKRKYIRVSTNNDDISISFTVFSKYLNIYLSDPNNALNIDKKVGGSYSKNY